MDAQTFQLLVVFLASGGVVGTVIAGAFALITKRTRTPESRLAEAQFSVKVYQDQLLEARRDKELNDQTIQTLREYVTRVEADGRQDQELIRDLYQQMRAIEARNGEKDEMIRSLQTLIDRVAEKVARGDVITLDDLGRSPLPDDLEETTY